MNYGKKSTAKKQRNITSKKNMGKKRRGVRFLKALLLILILAIVLTAGAMLVVVRQIIKKAPNITPANVKPEGYSTVVYNEDGSKELQRFVASNANRIYKPIGEIPVNLQHAFVAIEDERFYEHQGIDPQGIIRAFAVGVMHHGNFSQGASTLTQQLIKNTVYTNFVHEKNFKEKLERKIQEQYLALRLEKQMSKDAILENYLNTINLGQDSLGVQTAAQRYFGKDVSDLTLSECAVIAGITQNPTRFNPLTNPEDNAMRRKLVLKKMLECDFITKEEYNEALSDDVYKRIQNFNTEHSTVHVHNTTTYFIDALATDVQKRLEQELGYSPTQAFNTVFRGGLSIYATQDAGMQQICDNAVNNPANYHCPTEIGLTYALTVTRADGTVENFGHHNIKTFRKEKYGDKYGLVFSSEDAARAAIEEWKSTIAQEGDTYDERVYLSPQPQASVVLMDPATGEVKALTGGRGQKATSRSFNRATEALRQPGSTFKILATYAPALDTSGYTLASIEKDEPYAYKNGKKIRNAYNGFLGNITIRKAIEQSCNVVAVKVLTDITPALGMKYLKSFGITTLVEKPDTNGNCDTNQALTLGGITNGVTNLEMAAAYSAIANHGLYNPPVFFTKVLDHNGKVLLDNTRPDSHTVLKDSTAALLTKAMEDVMAKGTGRTALLDSGMPCAGKTGTTDDKVDIWLCGFTPYYVCSVWGGYDDNKPLTDSYFHMRIWKEIMTNVHLGLPNKAFDMPSSIEKATICLGTGKLAGKACPTITEWFAKGSLPTETCTSHIAAPKKPKPKNNDSRNDEHSDADHHENTSDDTSGHDHGGTSSDTPSTDNGSENTDTPETPPTENGTPTESE